VVVSDRLPRTSAALSSQTAAGLIGALPAAVSYNVVRMCPEMFESSRSSTRLDAALRSYEFAQTLPSQRRLSGFPAFALLLRSPIPVACLSTYGKSALAIMTSIRSLLA